MVGGEKNIVLVGFMGTGKSMTGRMLAKKLKRSFVDLDEQVARQARKTIPEIFAQEGEAGFRQRETQQVAKLCEKGGQVIAAGGGVMLSEENVQALRRSGILICLTARPEVILSRALSSLGSRPLLNGSNPREKVEELLALRAPFYAKADFSIDTSDRSIDEVAEEILRYLNEDSRRAH